jgi:hypothetical protein
LLQAPLGEHQSEQSPSFIVAQAIHSTSVDGEQLSIGFGMGIAQV